MSKHSALLLLLAIAAIGCGGDDVATSGLAPEGVVAGGKDDLMVVRHVVLRGTNKEIGAQLAKLAKDNHGAVPGKLDPKVGARRMDWFTENYPELVERASGAATVFPEKGLDNTSINYDLNFQPGCSVVYYPGTSVSTSHAMMSRNYDFPKGTYAEITHQPEQKGARSMTGDPYVIEAYPSNGLASLYICSYDLLAGAIDGVNEKGVSVALLADDQSKTPTRGEASYGLGEIDFPRYILDKAKSAKEARALAMAVPYYSTFTPCHYIIGDATGDSFIFEVDKDNKHHIIDGEKKPQIVTNHLIFEYGTSTRETGNSFDRYRKLQEEIGKFKAPLTPEEVRVTNLCVAVPEDVKVHGTLWHAVYDLEDRSVSVSFCLSKRTESKERRSPYLLFKLQK